MSLDAAPVPAAARRPRSRSRSRSPMLALASAAITSKVIKRLEGLTHLEMLGVSSIPEDDTEDIASSNVSDTERERDLLFELDDDTPEGEKVILVVDENQVKRRRRGSTPQPVVNGATPKRVNWEISRKLLHSSIGQSSLLCCLAPGAQLGLGFFTLYLYVTERDVSKVVLTLWSSLCIIVPADILRFRWPTFERLYERVLGFLMRESEKVPLSPTCAWVITYSRNPEIHKWRDMVHLGSQLCASVLSP
jgi:diacylglycerol kinase (CTP)